MSRKAMLIALEALEKEAEGYEVPPSIIKEALAALRAALAEASAPVALESVELQRDTNGMCTVLVNGRVAIRDNGDVISHHATLNWFSGTADKILSEECGDGDALLRMLGLDPEQCRTEGGRLNLPRIRTALAETAPFTTCNCRWDGETQVAQCELHQAHVNAIHEWAERAKKAEAALAESGADQSELQSLREANEAFAKRQAWWTERMFELEQERDKFGAALAEAEKAEPCEKCARWEEIVADEMSETKQMMELGGAREGENFNQLFARLVTERDQFKAEAQADAEPVARIVDGGLHWNIKSADWSVPSELLHGVHNLYLHPPRREPDGTYIDQIAEAKADFETWPQWMKEAARISAVNGAAPSRESAELSDELMRALRESHMYDSEQRYFEPRPVEDGNMQRKAFYAGFERGWDAAIAVLRAAGGEG